MPKCSPAKRRKKEVSKDDITKQSKKGKRSRKQEDSEKIGGRIDDGLLDENVDHSDTNEDACSEQSLDIDQTLDRNASKSNLSVFNVKSIIHVSITVKQLLRYASTREI